METSPINIAIVDDHTLFREGMAALLCEFSEINILFQAGHGIQMQQMLQKENAPDVILMDINMPLMDGYDATAWLYKNYPEVKVLALSMFEDDVSVIKMIKAGACGYVLKESRPRELLNAITHLHERGSYMNELVSRKLLKNVKEESSKLLLTKRELQFMKLCCSELTYKEIADKMFVNHRTVDNYRESLFLKLNLKSRVGIVLYAIKNQIFNFKENFQ
ncbi:response regulator transcription factor [Mucilaginibacter sp. KACC 22063]|uniref:response regulator transcription factor n=1 Tax=Mucilaginibacter sp. KACC 22063 TaxID=3025666 RepID=UPI0023668ECC|nr:response regulator transcription factor [Mucilaginibacter sp. KACC 22063]WDF55729.1 response regulator transcription factor [Mucilaginibacter sp. KACC 22063]